MKSNVHFLIIPKSVTSKMLLQQSKQLNTSITRVATIILLGTSVPSTLDTAGYFIVLHIHITRTHRHTLTHTYINTLTHTDIKRHTHTYRHTQTHT